MKALQLLKYLMNKHLIRFKKIADLCKIGWFLLQIKATWLTEVMALNLQHACGMEGLFGETRITGDF